MKTIVISFQVSDDRGKMIEDMLEKGYAITTIEVNAAWLHNSPCIKEYGDVDIDIYMTDITEDTFKERCQRKNPPKRFKREDFLYSGSSRKYFITEIIHNYSIEIIDKDQCHKIK